MKRVLVVSPHPDDESIGCGGAICDHVDKGEQVRILFLTSGEASEGPTTGEHREQEARDAAAVLGVEELDFWRQPDGGLRASGELATRLQDLLARWKPYCVYVPHRLELHPDHRAAYRLVRRAVAGMNGTQPVVLTYEVWTPLPQVDHSVDISPYMDTKLAAIRAHKSQCELVAFDDAAEALSRYRGAIYSWPGGPYAETFLRLQP